jgi:hypothetical protein
MGSTPELRDLAARLGFNKVVVVDSSSPFFAYATTLCAHNYFDNETLVNDDWRAFFGQNESTFGAILSDLTMGNVPYSDRKDLYGDIGSSLLSGGYFIDKVLTREAPLVSTEEIRNRFRSSPVNWAVVNEFNCAALFCSATHGETIDSTERYAELLSEFANYDVIVKLTNLCERITPSGMTWYYGKDWSAVAEQYMCPSWRVARIPQPTDSPYHGHAYHLIHRKRA